MNKAIDFVKAKHQRLLKEIYAKAEVELRKLYNVPDNYRLFPRQDDGIDHD